jgi:hypothetical protein
MESIQIQYCEGGVVFLAALCRELRRKDEGAKEGINSQRRETHVGVRMLKDYARGNGIAMGAAKLRLDHEEFSS